MKMSIVGILGAFHVVGRKATMKSPVTAPMRSPVLNKGVNKKIWHEMLLKALEFIESIFIIFLVLAVFKVTGLHGWWIRLVDNLLSHQ